MEPPRVTSQRTHVANCLLPSLCVCMCVRDCIDSQSQHAGAWCGICGILVAACGSLVVACELLVLAWGIQFSDHGLNPAPWHWECGALAPGPPGKSTLSFEITCQIMTQVMLIPLSFQEKFWACCWDILGPSVKGPVPLARLPFSSPQSVLGVSVSYGSPYMPQHKSEPLFRTPFHLQLSLEGLFPLLLPQEASSLTGLHFTMVSWVTPHAQGLGV